MKKVKSPSWQSIREEVFRRISQREWQPGDSIPNESELATAFGCARATVNRALQELANEGLLDRRRKGGTKVALHPVRKATLDIPITRQEVEQRGAAYSYQLFEKKLRQPTKKLRKNIQLNDDQRLLFLRALHLADSKPFLYEERWINTELVPTIMQQDLNTVSANEWLVNNAVYTRVDLTMFAANATARQAECLNTTAHEALFIVDRTTWRADAFVTSVQLCYAPGYRIETSI